jgi:hypothetical protein
VAADAGADQAGRPGVPSHRAHWNMHGHNGWDDVHMLLNLHRNAKSARLNAKSPIVIVCSPVA